MCFVRWTALHNNQRDDGKDLKDPKDTKRPEQPVSGPGVGGRLGTTGGTLLTQYLMKEKGMIKVRPCGSRGSQPLPLPSIRVSLHARDELFHTAYLAPSHALLYIYTQADAP